MPSKDTLPAIMQKLNEDIAALSAVIAQIKPRIDELKLFLA